MQTATAAPPPPATPPPRPQAKWLPLLGLIAVMLFVTMGGFLFTDEPAGSALAESGDVETGTAVEVATGVTIEPAAGWTVTDQVLDPQGVILQGGNGRLLVGVPGGTGTPEGLVDFYATNYLEPQSSQFSLGEIQPLSLPAGPAVSAAYVGVFEGVSVPIEGEIIAVVSASGTGVLLDGWASQGTYAAVHEQVVAMAGTVVVN